MENPQLEIKIKIASRVRWSKRFRVSILKLLLCAKRLNESHLLLPLARHVEAWTFLQSNWHRQVLVPCLLSPQLLSRWKPPTSISRQVGVDVRAKEIRKSSNSRDRQKEAIRAPFFNGHQTNLKTSLSKESARV